MYRILNVNFAGQKLAISEELVEFDNDGIAELKSEELYKGVIRLPNFTAVEVFGPKQEGEVSDYDAVGDYEVEEQEEEVDKIPKLASENLTHKELDTKAKDLGIKVEGEKKDKVATINKFIIENF